MDYKKPSPDESFINWVQIMKRKIDVLMESGFSKDQAIEMLKVYMLSDLENVADAISCIS